MLNPQSAHISVSPQPFSNPHAPLSVTWDKNCRVVLLSFFTKKKKVSGIIKIILFFLFLNLFIYSPIRFLPLSLLTVTHLACLPTLASSKTLSKVQCEKENERQWGEAGWSRSRDALWVTLLNEARRAVHGTPSAEHTSKPVFALVLSTFGERERSEGGGAAFEQRWVLTHLFSCLFSL